MPFLNTVSGLNVLVTAELHARYTIIDNKFTQKTGKKVPSITYKRSSRGLAQDNKRRISSRIQSNR